MSISTVNSLFRVALNTFATAQSLEVAWENRDYTPTVGETYLRATSLPTTPRASGLGTAALDYVRGIFQVDVIGDTGDGTATTYTIADSLRAHFGRGDKLTGTGTSVTIESVSAGPAIVEDARYQLPVSITFYAHMSPA